MGVNKDLIHRASDSLMSMAIKWIIGYGIYSSHQLNTYERFWTNMLNCILNHHQNTNVLESSDQTHLKNLTKVFRNTWKWQAGVCD